MLQDSSRSCNESELNVDYEDTFAVGIIESDDVFRQSIAGFLRLQNMQVYEALNIPDFLNQTIKNQPVDVILIDPNLQDDGDINCIKDLSGSDGVGIIVLSARASKEVKTNVINSGADDYLTKPVDFHELLARLRRLHRRVKPGKFSKEYHLISGQLSKREKYVFVAIAQGKTLVQIGKELEISFKTVETYRRRITGKLNVKSIADITRMAVKAGIVF